MEIREKSGENKVVREKRTLLTKVREKQELGDIFLNLSSAPFFRRAVLVP